MKLERNLVQDLHRRRNPLLPSLSCTPLQAGMQQDPWRVAVASMLLCRTRRVQAEPALALLLAQWPTPGDLLRADVEAVETAVRGCGFARNRTRQLQRFSGQFVDSAWSFMRELSGVGPYVADAVALFCFGDKEVACADTVLREYAESLAHG